METIQPIHQSPQPSSKNPYKILFFISLGLFLIVSTVLITLLITQKSTKSVQLINNSEIETFPTQSAKQEPTDTPTIPTPSATSSSIPNNWKTYSDTTYKFSISYPHEWTLETNIDDVNRFTDVFTIKSPEGEKEEKKIKSEPPTAEGYPSPCGFYYINCYKSFNLFKTESRIQENTLLTYLNSYDFGDFTQSTTNGHVLYSVISNSLGGGRYFYIQNKDTSFCSLQFCWQTSSGKELTPIEKQFVNSFKFN